MSEQSFDVVVVGSGPGGYVCAIRCAQLGLKTAIVERFANVGGTCLNVGCIPSKALLDSSEHFHQAQHGFAVHGISLKDLTFDFGKMISRKNEVIKATVEGINYLFAKNKVTRFQGLGSFADASTIVVTDAGKESARLKAAKVVLATGSKPVDLKFMPNDGKNVISSTEALCLDKVPKHLIVVGGGVIGLELGSVYARLGAKVSVVEFMDNIIPTMDAELGKALQRSLKKLGFSFHLSTKVLGAKTVKGQTTVSCETAKGDKLELVGDKVLVCVGRRPYTQGLDCDKAGVTLDERGFIKVDAHLQTSTPGIYAIGDVVGGAMLAHKAEEEGVYVAELLAGQKPHVNYNTIPGVVYTWPEVAAVGQTEEQLKKAGIAYKTGKFPYKASGRARASEETDGFVKVLAHADTDEILGVHILGPRASDVIAECVVAMEYKASAEDLGRICHAHPTFSEPVKEAALAAWNNCPIHI